MILRQNYAAIKAKYKKIGKAQVRLTQSTIILIQNIVAAKNAYTFPILENDTATAIQAQEIRLNINDEFIAGEIAFYLGADVTDAASPAITKRLLTYAPDELNVAARVLDDVYNGNLQIQVNKISFLEKWDMKKHNCFTQTQFQSTSAGIPGATLPNINFANDGTYPLQPMLTLSGAKKNDIIISLPVGIAPAVIAWTAPLGGPQSMNINNLWLVFRGLLGQNASKFQG